MNPKMNGQIQTEWRSMIAVYFFLAGVGAGAYAVGSFFSLTGGGGPAAVMGISLGFPLVLIGSLFLMADLGATFDIGAMFKSWRVVMKPGTSWISRGTMIISIFMFLALIHGLGQKWCFGFIEAGSDLHKVVGILGIVFALGTMVYTGALIGTAKGMAFWKTGVMPVLFLLSALLTGLFGIMVGVVVAYNKVEAMTVIYGLSSLAVVLLVIELLTIFFLLHISYKTPDAGESASRMVRKPAFIFGDLLLGLIVPLVLMIVIAFGMKELKEGMVVALGTIGAILGLVGGFLLRYAILAVGTLPTLNASGFEFRRIAIPKEPKAGIGKLPPS